MPDIGDANTPWAEVERFYNFWFIFKCVHGAAWDPDTAGWPQLTSQHTHAHTHILQSPNALLSPLTPCFHPCCRSWREFPHPDEEDLEGAESREHRRWLERNNAKLREKSACGMPRSQPQGLASRIGLACRSTGSACTVTLGTCLTCILLPRC